MTAPTRQWSITFPLPLDEQALQNLEDQFGVSLARLRLQTEFTVGRRVLVYEPAGEIEMLLVNRAGGGLLELEFFSNVDGSVRSPEWRAIAEQFSARVNEDRNAIGFAEDRFVDVVSQALGILLVDEATGALFISNVIPVGQHVPARAAHEVVPTDPAQRSIKVDVFEQATEFESRRVEENLQIHQIEIDLPEHTLGHPLMIEFFVDLLGTLTVTVSSAVTGIRLYSAVVTLSAARPVDLRGNGDVDIVRRGALRSSQSATAADNGVLPASTPSSTTRAPESPTTRDANDAERLSKPQREESADTVLPVYLVLDTSASMSGTDQDALRNDVELIVRALRSDVSAAQRLALGVVTFSDRATEARELSRMSALWDWPEYATGGSTDFAALFDDLTVILQRDSRRLRESMGVQLLNPMIFLITDGGSTTPWQESFARFQDLSLRPFVIAFGVRDAEREILRTISEGRYFVGDPGVEVSDLIRIFGDVVATSLIRFADSDSANRDLSVEVPDEFKH
jgi:uncharacterized protein YegL